MNNIISPPQNINAERDLLGSIMINNAIIYQTDLTAEMFYKIEHQEIFRSMLVLKNEKEQINVHSIHSKNNRLKLSDLIQLSTTICNVSDWKSFSNIVKDCYIRREMINSFSRYMNLLHNQSNNLSETVNDVKNNLAKISVGGKFTVETNPNLAIDWLNNYGKVSEVKIGTGMSELDSAFGRFKGTELGIIIADTNVGKTSLLLNWALSMIKQGKKVLFFSLEMGSDELMSKLVAMDGNHSAFDIYTEAVSPQELQVTIDKFKKYPLTIVSKGTMTSQDVISEAYTRKMQGEVDVVMVDYLQLLADATTESETIRLARIAKNLKGFALDNKIPVITPAQIDKASSKSGKIEGNNVAGSKEIINSSDIGFYLYEKESQNKKSINGKVDIELRLRIVKSRHSGKFNDFLVDFNRKTLKMTIKGEQKQETGNIEDVFGLLIPSVTPQNGV